MKLVLKTAFAIMFFLAGIVPASFAYAEGWQCKMKKTAWQFDCGSGG